jgi:protoporphyrinogen oxidase
MKIAIIGAGIGGMAAAFDLARAGNEVEIFEAANYVGGLAAGFKDPSWDWTVERFYHHWFESDQDMWTLMKELGLYEKRVVLRPLTVMYSKGKFYPFDSILAAILYPGLGWGINKIRFGFVGLFLRLSKSWPALEKFTVDEWMRKWAGNQVYEEMWEPMMVGKFGERYARVVNMAWMWARLHTRTTRLVTYQGGFQAFSDQFAAKLREMGIHIHLSTPIQSISPCPEGGLEIQTADGMQRFDQVLTTTSPALLAQMAPRLPQDYLQGLLALKSIGAVVLTLALKHQLSTEGYYWYNLPKSAGFPFLALVEHTNFLSPKYFNGDHILYIGDYLEPDHEFFRLSKDEILQRYLPSLKRFNPNFQPDWVRDSWMYRTAYAQPVPLVNHSRNIPDIRTPIPGLYFASMSQVYPWDRGTNFAVRIAREAAGMMLKDQPARL